MNWSLLFTSVIIAAFFAWIGAHMLFDKHSSGPERFCGAVVILVGGLVLFVGSSWAGRPPQYLDEKACVQYVYLEDTWKCVPVEEAG